MLPTVPTPGVHLHRVCTFCRRTGWEPLWVLGIEGIGYCLSILEPSFGQLKLANGTSIAWLRYSGWMVTCPVLLMFLTAMTTCGGNKPRTRP